MHNRFRYPLLIGAVVAFSIGLVGPSGFGLSPVLASEKGKSESKGNSDKDGNSGKSAESRGNSASNPSASYASRGKNATSGAHALYASVKDEYGFRNFGEFSSYLKSWRSAWRSPAAYEATMGNLNSLPGRQYAYADAFVARQTALETFTAAAPGVDPGSLPTLSDYNDALAVLGALDAQTVIDTGLVSYSQDQIDAATKVLQYEQYEEWDTYQKAVASADAAFLATLPGNPTVIDPDLQTLVDEIVVQINLSGAEAGVY